MERIGRDTLGAVSCGVVYETIKSALALQHPMTRNQVTIRELLGNTGRTAAYVGLIGALFSAGTVATATFRDKEDSLNYGVGGAMAGAFMGLRAGKLHNVAYAAIIFGGAGVISGFLGDYFENKTKDDKSTELAKRFAYFKAEKAHEAKH